MNNLLFWVLFNLFVFVMLALDLGVFHRGSKVVRFREAMIWSVVWVLLAGVFACLIYFWHGPGESLDFVAGYVLELSLSVDNLFVFLLIFRFFRVPAEYQHKVLFWGILGALAMRGIFIFAGIGLMQKLHWIVYVFGALLVYTGINLFRQKEAEIHPEKNPVLRIFRRFLPVTEDFEGQKFFVRRPALHATPLFIVLLVVETTDVIFAVDSVPAILAITVKAFIVYTSNVFAILGLRSMYFALSGMMEAFEYLHYGLALILMFVGTKMLISHYYEITTVWTLVVVAAVLTVSIVASLVRRRRLQA